MWRLISVRTLSRVRVRKWVAPIHALRVPNGCSTVWRRTPMASGMRSSRSCMTSRTSSCFQRLTHGIDPHCPGDILDLLLAHILEGEVKPTYLSVDIIGDANAARLRQGLQTCCNIYPVAKDIVPRNDPAPEI